jgi:hypothetical protein
MRWLKNKFFFGNILLKNRRPANDPRDDDLDKSSRILT